MRAIAIFSALFALLSPSKGYSETNDGKQIAASSSGQITVGDIDGESDPKMSVVNIRLDRQPSFSQVGEIQDHGSFLQLVIPNAIVPEPGKFYDGNNPYLPKIAVFQINPNDAAVRFFTSSDAAAIRKSAQAEILGNRIVLTLDHSKLAGPPKANSEHTATLVGPPAPEELRPKPSVSAQQIVESTLVNRDIAEPATQLKSPQQTAALGSLNLRDKLVQVALFIGVMILGLLATVFLKPLLRRRAKLKDDYEPAISMKTLASLPLAPRQKVSLIQVGDEKILIGVTPDAVTFLTSIQKSSPRNIAPSFARSLQENAVPAVELHRTPVLKNLPGNDEASLRATAESSPAARSANPIRQPVIEQSAETRTNRGSTRLEDGRPPVQKSKKPVIQKSGRINVAIGEDGVKNLAPAQTKNYDDSEDGTQAIDDVTRLIREKLKSLRTI